MKKTILFGCLCVMFLMAYGYGEQTRPMAVSPGSESGLVVVSQSCPTFSWSAVEWSEAYKVAIFPAVGTEVLTHEEMERLASPIVNKEIHGRALSWTPSEEERLASGETYVWYVQAVDTSGIGVWSEGRMFQVDETVRILGVKEKLRESLKEYGMRGEDIERVLTEATFDLQAVEVKESSQLASGYMGTDQGTEGAQNTYYGLQAGAIATGIFNSFFGVNAGRRASGNSNLFMGVSAGYANTTGYHNNFLGTNAGRRNTTGSRNTFQGNSSGYSNTIGNKNSFYGWGAGYKNTASENTFFGAYCGYNNTTGYNNTFMGFDAGRDNTTGNHNTFIGIDSGLFNTTGQENTFIGCEAGCYNTTGSHNTFLGFVAGSHNTTGLGNTFIGNSAGYATTSANCNTFIGGSAGRFNTTGFCNTFIGYDAGYYNIDGYDNIFLGWQAGNSNTSGFYNIFLGDHAGLNNTTGYLNVFLGYKAGYNETGSNKLYIDNSDTSSPLIYGEFDTDKVVINSYLGVGVNPTHRIDVTGGAYCDGTNWVNASSREVKENIESLGAEEAMNAFEKLEPVKFNYKKDKEEDSVGFIAEDVPDLVATKDRKGMVTMDVVAVLTKVVQEQQKIVQNQQEALNEQQKVVQEQQLTLKKQQETIDELSKQIDDLKKRK